MQPYFHHPHSSGRQRHGMAGVRRGAAPSPEALNPYASCPRNGRDPAAGGRLYDALTLMVALRVRYGLPIAHRALALRACLSLHRRALP
ncbi:hypothetical protein SAMN05192589_1058 [Paracidovorax valerianellae]|uniref:Uncharacterized protein n=1 Tax=Paracidovorax valerianellae TaxID=187868 RepID=A0A1G6SYQ1_9BURK|nr:hypothetical protein SAMN05192589_1058 [Paracidovorax valerianellae]